LKASQKYLSQASPELLTTLHRHHDVFRAMLQINLTVLATAHAYPKASCARQHRDAAPQYSQHLHSGRTARGAGTAADHALTSAARSDRHRSHLFAKYRHFSSNLCADISANFSAFSNATLRGAVITEIGGVGFDSREARRLP